MQLDALALLDLEGGERFVLSDADQGLRPATDMPWEHVAMALEDDRFFMREVVPETTRVAAGEVGLLRASWRTRQGLVDGDDLQRLLWTLQRFAPELEVDLQRVGVDLGELWRMRRWRRLLNEIDHLPRATWTQMAMANHPEYAEKMAEILASRRPADDDDEEEWSPPLIDHTPEVAMLASVVDAVNALRAVLIAVNSEGGKVPKIPPYPRPKTLVDTMREKAQRKADWAAHDRLRKRLLSRYQEASE